MTRQNDFRKNDILNLIWDFNSKFDRDEEKQSKKALVDWIKKEIIKLADENLDKTGSRFISLKIGRNIARSSLREILDKKQEILSSSNNKSSNTVRVKPSVQQEFEEDMDKQLKAIFKTAILFDGKASCNTNCEERKILQDANTKNAILEIMELQYQETFKSCLPEEWNFVQKSHQIDYQMNGHDCGPYVMVTAEHICRNAQLTFLGSQMAEYRIRIAQSLLTGSLNI